MTSATVPMDAVARVERTGRALRITVNARGALWFGAVLVFALAVLAAVDALIALPHLARTLALPAVLTLAVLALLRVLRRGRYARSPERVALWIEERTPSLRYALATLVDAGLPPTGRRAELESVVAQEDWSAPLRRDLIRALAVPAALLLAGALALTLLPPAAVARVGRPRPGDVLDAVTGARSRRSVLSPLVATVTPPAYTGRRAVTLEEPSSVGGIAASEVVLAGQGDASRVTAMLGDDTLRARASGQRWELRFRMPDLAAPLRLADGVAERVVAIEPYPDSVPVVTMRTPVRDTVFRQPTGTLALTGDAADDLGLTEAWFEYIITSGEMESFRFRTGSLQRVAPAGARAVRLAATLDLAALRLVPGDVVHLRAVGTDGNTVTGPGRGVSETRIIRVARPGEFDSLAIEGLPSILGDTSALSQRMLILMAEALQRRRPQLTRDTVVGESRSIAVDQARLRRRVADVIFMRAGGEAAGEESEGDEGRPTTPEEVLAAAEASANRNADTTALDFAEDESPVVSVNRPLLEAYNAMWQAGRDLEIGEPDDALPHMRVALAAIQRARQAERLYLRGRPPTRVVDLRAARLKGDRAGAASARRIPGPAAAERGQLEARLNVAFGVAGRSASDAADSLLLLRLEALGKFPSFAMAAGRAAAALRAGRDAVPDLLRARDALLGEPRHDSALGLWEVAP